MAVRSTHHQHNPLASKSMKNMAKVRKRASTLTDVFEKVVEFPAEGPGRVIVRLERLMGSDKIRLTDPRYMALLLKRLEEEEDRTWYKRTRERRKAEHIRFRQLVIDGHADPAPGMQDLYSHPVFRINRILQRLSKLGISVEAHAKLPPIHPIDPFEEDDTGGVFKNYPGHLTLFSGGEDDLTKFLKQIGYIKRVNSDDEIDEDEDYLQEVRQAASDYSLVPPEYGREDMDEDGDDSPRALKIREIQKKYGVAPNTDLAIEWKPYRSHLVDKIFSNEDDGVWDLYENSDNIADVYDRQLQVTEEYISSMRGGRADAFFENRKELMKKHLASQGELDEEEKEENEKDENEKAEKDENEKAEKDEIEKDENEEENADMVSTQSPPKSKRASKEQEYPTWNE